nr:unnamed protein product [Callosobruchus chinensis]
MDSEEAFLIYKTHHRFHFFTFSAELPKMRTLWLFGPKHQLEHLNNFALLTNVNSQNDKAININNLRNDISNYISRNIFDNTVALSSQTSPLRIQIPLNTNEIDPLEQPNSNSLDQPSDNQLNQQQQSQFVNQQPSPYFNQQLQQSSFANQQIQPSPFANQQIQQSLFANQHIQPSLFANQHIQPSLFANQQVQASPFTNQQIQASSPYFNQQSSSPFFNNQQAQLQLSNQQIQSTAAFQNQQFQSQQLNNQISQDQVIVPKPYAIRVPHPVPVPVHIRVPVPVDRPYAVQITKTVAVPVEKPVYIKVPQPIEVPVAQPYPVSVPQAVEVKVPYPVYVRSSNDLQFPRSLPGKEGVVSIQTDPNPVTASSKKVEVSTTAPATSDVNGKPQDGDSKDRNKRIPEGIGLVPPFYSPQFSDSLLGSYVESKNGGVFGLNKYQTAQYHKTW